MARKKSYNEKEVIEKATELFWHYGYEMTSMSALEKAMGINKFSIYSSFGSKQGVFIECLKSYKKKISVIVDKLKDSPKGKDAIKEFFYDFLLFSKDNKLGKGCLLTTTVGDSGVNGDVKIMAEILIFADDLKSIFIEKLKIEGTKDEKILMKQANFLLIAKQALSNASKVFDNEILNDFIEITLAKI